MDNIFLTLFNRSICAGWLILAVIALRFLIKRAPKWTLCALWAIVAVRLICPFSFESAFSLIPSAETLPSDEVQYAKRPEIHSGVAAIDRAVNPVIRESFAPETGTSANPLHIRIWLLGIAWLAGLLALMSYGLFSCLKLKKSVSEAVPLRQNVYLCDTVRSPFLFGILRPAIYLPAGLDEETMRYVLSHERAHLKRRDHWWKALGYVLLCFYWFHPLVWIAYALFCRDIELACDEKAVSHFDLENKKAYSHALVACSVGRKAVLFCPLAFGEVGVKERVKAVLNYKKPAFWLVGVSAVICALVAVCFLTDPQSEAKELTGKAADAADPADEPEGAPAQPDKSDTKPMPAPDSQTVPTDDSGTPAGDEPTDTQPPDDPGTPAGDEPTDTQPPDDPGTPTGDEPTDTQPPDDSTAMQTVNTGYPLYDSLIAAATHVLRFPQAEEYDYERTLFTSAYFYSEMTWQTPGYLLLDLDGNGTPELLFGENHDDDWNGIIYNIYTISDGALVHVADGWERNRYYLCENGCIANEGSGGASESVYCYYTFDGSALKPVEAVVYDASANPEHPWFYTAKEPFSGTASLTPVSEADARAVMDKYTYLLPQFTPFLTQR